MVVSPQQKVEDEQQRANRGGAMGGGGTLNRNTGSGGGGAGSGSGGGGGVVKTEKLVFTMPKLQVCIYQYIHRLMVQYILKYSVWLYNTSI